MLLGTCFGVEVFASDSWREDVWTYIGRRADLYRFTARPIGDCCGRVLFSIYCAKASHAQLPDVPLRSDTQALRLIARIPLIRRREKHRSREEKSAFT